MNHGLYKLVMPAKYMNKNVSPEDAEVFELYKKAFDECMEGKRKGIIFPAVTDNDGNYLFDLQYVGPSSITVNNVVSPNTELERNSK